MMPAVRLLVWLAEGTWETAVDAAASIAAEDAELTLLYVTPLRR